MSSSPFFVSPFLFVICSLLFRSILFFFHLYLSLDRPNRRSFSLESGRAGQTKDRREEGIDPSTGRPMEERGNERGSVILGSIVRGHSENSSSSSIRRISDLENSLRSTDKSGVVDPVWRRVVASLLETRHGKSRRLRGDQSTAYLPAKQSAANGFLFQIHPFETAFSSRLAPQVFARQNGLIPISIYIRTSNTLEIMNAWG